MTKHVNLRSVWCRCRRLGTGLLWMLLGLGAAGCTRQGNREAGSEEITRQASIRAAQEFLRETAVGDSVRLARVARDTVVRTVLLNHRLGSTEHFRAGAETFRSPKVDAYPSASDVRFRYQFEGQEFDAFVALELEGGQLRVTNYGIPAIIN